MKTLSSIASHPLFSTLITLYTLILLYFPTPIFLGIFFSPVIIISTSILLLSLLRLGAIQKSIQEGNAKEKISISISNSDSSQSVAVKNHVPDASPDLLFDDHKWVSSEDSGGSSEGEEDTDLVPTGNIFLADSFVEWDVRAPLEVIHEGYEDEGEENEDGLEEKREAQISIIERYASLSKFYPETDSDVSSEEDFSAIRDWDSPESLCFRLEGEDKEGLIEIELEQKGYSEVEEDNLIEIDLSPAGFPAR